MGGTIIGRDGRFRSFDPAEDRSEELHRPRREARKRKKTPKVLRTEDCANPCGRGRGVHRRKNKNRSDISQAEEFIAVAKKNLQKIMGIPGKQAEVDFLRQQIVAAQGLLGRLRRVPGVHIN